MTHIIHLNLLTSESSFYPIFPVPLELSSDVNLDVSHSEHLKLGGSAPDILVLPSILRQFSKVCYVTAPNTQLIWTSLGTECRGYRYY